MRIIHVAPRLHARGLACPPEVHALASAQARLNGGKVQIVAAAPESRQTRTGDLEERLLAASLPRWLGRSRALRHHLANSPLEIVHAHCLGERALHYAHFAAQRHGAPFVISPGGAFGLGARDRVRVRCTFQRLFIHPQALELASGWHATSAEEASAIHSCGFRQPVCVAPPGVSVPSTAALAAARRWWEARFPILAGRPVALSDTASARETITLWAGLAPADWLLLVVAKDSRSVAQLTATAARLRVTERVLIATAGEEPPHAIARLFIMIDNRHTLTEPVATALAAGLPAFVSENQPWSRLDADHAGWCVPRREFASALARALATPSADLADLGRNARALAEHEFNWDRSAERLLAFYRNLRR
jgi:hypothetical protein